MYVKPKAPVVVIKFRFINGDIHEIVREIPIGQQNEPDKFADAIMTDHLYRKYIKFDNTLYPTDKITCISYVSKE